MHVVVREYRTSFLRRMWNSSEFMRTYKQHFTMSFNGRRDHHGTMFEGRYHESNRKPEPEVMWKTAAYIDINAWEAGIVKRPEDYEWGRFAAAVKGDETRRGSVPMPFSELIFNPQSSIFSLQAGTVWCALRVRTLKIED